MQAPISVYTSGKGSSAAGLTATVVKDSHGEFFLEVSDGIFSWWLVGSKPRWNCMMNDTHEVVLAVGLQLVSM